MRLYCSGVVEVHLLKFSPKSLFAQALLKFLTVNFFGWNAQWYKSGH